VTGDGRFRRALVVLVAVGMVALAACGSDTEVTETKDGKVTVEGKGKKAKVTIEGEHGASVTFNQQTVPASFPSEVPRPQKLALQSAASGTRGGKQYFQLSYALGSTTALDAIGAYATRLGAAGFTVDQTDAPGNDADPSPMQADGKGWHVLALATGAGSGSLTMTVTNA
jgi:hypothetical protein